MSAQLPYYRPKPQKKFDVVIYGIPGPSKFKGKRYKLPDNIKTEKQARRFVTTMYFAGNADQSEKFGMIVERGSKRP